MRKFLERSKLIQIRGLKTLDRNVSLVLDYWFKPGQTMEAKYEMWYSGRREVDEDIKMKFGKLVCRDMFYNDFIKVL